MKDSSTSHELHRRCRELESVASLWMAANEAKAERIRELEAQCHQLQQRVARLSRLAMRQSKPAPAELNLRESRDSLGTGRTLTFVPRLSKHGE